MRAMTQKRKSGPRGGSREPQRISKLLAQRGLCSRREAERLIANGQVLLDGAVVREQGVKALPDAQLEIADRGQQWLDDRVTILMHKPVGVVSTQPEGGQVPAWKLLTRTNLREGGDPEAVKRVLEHPYYLNVAGRLDKDSRGLLVLTQDGSLAKRLTSGSGVTKKYRVNVDADPTPEQVKKLSGRMELDGRQLRPMQVRRNGRNRLRFELREGRKHQIRRVCEQVGLRVVDLMRTDIGNWSLGELPAGCWRLLGAEELRRFR